MIRTETDMELDRLHDEADGVPVRVRIWFEDAPVRTWRYDYARRRAGVIEPRSGTLDSNRVSLQLPRLRKLLLDALGYGWPVPSVGWSRDATAHGWSWEEQR